MANCHLEGDPHQPMTRVAQVRSALQEAARRGGPRGHALVLAGDMNARLGGSWQWGALEKWRILFSMGIERYCKI